MDCWMARWLARWLADGCLMAKWLARLLDGWLDGYMAGSYGHTQLYGETDRLIYTKKDRSAVRQKDTQTDT